MKAKALFLLFIFMFNTVVGFGCSLFMESDGHQHRLHLAHHHKTKPEAAVENSISKTMDKGDSCCKTISNNLIAQGKLAPNDLKINLKSPALIPVLSNYGLIFKEKNIAVNPYPIGQHRFHLPHPDIRVSIQSFQR